MGSVKHLDYRHFIHQSPRIPIVWLSRRVANKGFKRHTNVAGLISRSHAFCTSSAPGHHHLIELPAWEDYPACTMIIYLRTILIFLLGRAMMVGDSKGNHVRKHIASSPLSDIWTSLWHEPTQWYHAPISTKSMNDIMITWSNALSVHDV